MVEYPTLYPSGDTGYVAPSVKIETGARSALDPNQTGGITAFIDDELHDWSLDVESVLSGRRLEAGDCVVHEVTDIVIL